MKFIILLLLGIVSLNSCHDQKVSNQLEYDFDSEKAAILECLNNETKAAFARDYNSWTEFWIQEESITKTYINYVDESFSESVGWDEISGFVKKFIDDHPEPEPAPELLDDINVRLYLDGAWVSFQQMDSLRGIKRETRLMEKENGKWKIAGMHTTIYGFNEESKAQ